MNPTLLQTVFIDSAKKYPDKIALIAENKSFTYQFIFTQAMLFANELKQKNIQRGDRVLIQAGNSIYTIVAFWATLMADAIVSVIATDVEDKKLIQILKNAEPAFFITHQSPGTLQKIIDDFSSMKIYLIGDHSLKPYLSLSLTKTSADNKEITFKNQELDLASILYTSGSTGEPKGVMMTHRNMLTALFSVNNYLNYTQKDNVLCVLPLSFDYGLYQMIITFSVGGTLILEKDALFPAEILKKIQKYKVSILPGVPTLFNLIHEHAKRFQYDYSSLRIVTNTGAFLSENHITKIKKIFPNAIIFSMYGLTECKRCTYLPPSDLERKFNSVGIAIPNTELWIVDESGKKLGAGQIGQLVIRGATVMKGYWNNPAETERKLKSGPLGENILYTGDYGMLDEEGYLYFKGRMDEVIKFKGIKISPIEIEQKLMRLPNIIEAIIFDILHLEDTRLIFCVSSKITDHPSLKNQIRTALSRAEHPSHIFIFSHLPKNDNGKIDKNYLKETVKHLIMENIV